MNDYKLIAFLEALAGSSLVGAVLYWLLIWRG